MAAQKILNGPRQLDMDGREHPTLPAFIDASLDVASRLNNSFILRQYHDPNAFRQEEDEPEESLPGEEAGDEHVERIPERSERRATPGRENLEVVPNSKSSSTEEVQRTDYNFELRQANFSARAPSRNDNIADGRVLADSPNGEFTTTDIPSESIWGLIDLFPDNFGEPFSRGSP